MNVDLSHPQVTEILRKRWGIIALSLVSCTQGVLSDLFCVTEKEMKQFI